MKIIGSPCDDPKQPSNFYSAELEPGDAGACPFCGGGHLKLENTWTASYWMACDCGATMHGAPARDLGFNGDNPDHDEDAHRLAALDALKRWNDRAAPAEQRKAA